MGSCVNDGILYAAKVANFPSISVTTDFSMALCGVWVSDRDRIILDGSENQLYSARADDTAHATAADSPMPFAFTYLFLLST